MLGLGLLKTICWGANLSNLGTWVFSSRDGSRTRISSPSLVGQPHSNPNARLIPAATLSTTHATATLSTPASLFIGEQAWENHHLLPLSATSAAFQTRERARQRESQIEERCRDRESRETGSNRCHHRRELWKLFPLPERLIGVTVRWCLNLERNR